MDSNGVERFCKSVLSIDAWDDQEDHCGDEAVWLLKVFEGTKLSGGKEMTAVTVTLEYSSFRRLVGTDRTELGRMTTSRCLPGSLQRSLRP